MGLKCTWCNPCRASLCDCGPCGIKGCKQCDLMPIVPEVQYSIGPRFTGKPSGLGDEHPGCSYFALDGICNKCGWIKNTRPKWSDSDSEGAGGDGSL